MAGVFAVEDFRKQFPILSKPLKGGKKLVFFDNLATTQKPQCVIDKISDFYSNYNSNVHRGMYQFSEMATGEYESARIGIANYLCLDDPREIVFVSGTTDAINLVAHGYGKKFLAAGDEVLIGAAEHHANYLPWQMLEREIGIVRRIIPLNSNFTLNVEKYGNMFSSRTKFVAIQHMSNVIGSINDIAAMAKIAHRNGAKILIDGASSLASKKIDIPAIGCDFFACSAHKCFGPMGSGFLFGKYDLLREMLPYRTGGNIVNRVQFDETSFKLPPDKFEAGTPDIAAIIGMGEAINFLKRIDMPSAQNHLRAIAAYLGEKLEQIPGITIYGTPTEGNGVFSFNLDGVHAHDVATYLGSCGIAVRAGTHCAQPLMQLLNVPGTVRISLCVYNTMDEIDIAIDSLAKCEKMFHRERE